MHSWRLCEVEPRAPDIMHWVFLARRALVDTSPRMWWHVVMERNPFHQIIAHLRAPCAHRSIRDRRFEQLHNILLHFTQLLWGHRRTHTTTIEHARCGAILSPP